MAKGTWTSGDKIALLLKIASSAGLGKKLALSALAFYEIDVTDGLGRSALMHAALAGHAGACQMLLAAGASPAARDHRGLTAFDIALENGHQQAAQALAGTDDQVVHAGSVAAYLAPQTHTLAVPGESPCKESGWIADLACRPPVPDLHLAGKAREVQDRFYSQLPVSATDEWIAEESHHPRQHDQTQKGSVPVSDMALPTGTDSSASGRQTADSKDCQILRSACVPVADITPAKLPTIRERIWSKCDELKSGNGGIPTIVALKLHLAPSGFNPNTVSVHCYEWRRAQLAAQSESPSAAAPPSPASAGRFPSFVRLAPKPGGQPYGSSGDGDPAGLVRRPHANPGKLPEQKPPVLLPSVACGSGAERPPAVAPMLSDQSQGIDMRIHAIADMLLATGIPVTFPALRRSPALVGIDPNVIRSEYYLWRRSRDLHAIVPVPGLVSAATGAPPADTLTSPKNSVSAQKIRAARADGFDQPEESGIPGRIWAAADDLLRRERTLSLTAIEEHPTLRWLDASVVRTEYERWRSFNAAVLADADARRWHATDDWPASPGRTPAASGFSPEPPGERLAAMVEPVDGDWGGKATALAAAAGVPFKDMRPANGFFWVLLAATAGKAGRALSSELIALGFERVPDHGFRKK